MKLKDFNVKNHPIGTYIRTTRRLLDKMRNNTLTHVRCNGTFMDCSMCPLRSVICPNENNKSFIPYWETFLKITSNMRHIEIGGNTFYFEKEK